MNSSYLRVTDIYSLGSILTYLKSIKDPNDVVVFFDWDDTVVDPDYNKIIEPEITKELFDYMKNKHIFYSFITGRFQDTVCDDTKRNIFDIQFNIINTIFPVLNKLGIDTSRYQTNLFKQNPYKICDTSGKCVGLLYMGIFFSGTKGAAIKHYFRQTNQKKSEIIFVDDYVPYLRETTTSIPHVTAFRRLTGYSK
jgi:hypothetical protein